MKQPEPPVFSDPWHAQVFALTVQLNERGRFTWSAWAATFGTSLRARRDSGADDPEAGYWDAWLSALLPDDTPRPARAADASDVRQLPRLPRPTVPGVIASPGVIANRDSGAAIQGLGLRPPDRFSRYAPSR